VPDKVVAILVQLEGFQPNGHFAVAPQVDVEAQIDR
jgi:hypothetical protein